MHAEKLCHKWLRNVLPEMHKTRLEAVSAVVAGACQGGKLNVTTLGRSVAGRAKTKHKIKRADRLLSNRHLQSERLALYARLARGAVGLAEESTIIVDWSDVDERREFFLLRAAVARKGRSITLYEEIHSKTTKEKRKTHNEFLKRLKKILPPTCTPVIVTDAGFHVPWFRQVRSLGWHYVGRVRGRELVQLDSEIQWIKTKALHAQASHVAQKFAQSLLTQSNALECSLVLYKSKPKKRKRFTRMGHLSRSRRSLVNAARSREPWLLATSLVAHTAAKVVELYSKRMQIEESFRDLKCPRHGLSLSYNRTTKLERMKTLILIGTIAVTFAHLLGVAARQCNLHRQFQANTSAVPVLSDVFVGLQIARYPSLCSASLALCSSLFTGVFHAA